MSHHRHHQHATSRMSAMNDPLPPGDWRYVANTELIDPTRAANANAWYGQDAHGATLGMNGRHAAVYDGGREPGRRPMSDQPALLRAAVMVNTNTPPLSLLRAILMLEEAKRGAVKTYSL